MSPLLGLRAFARHRKVTLRAVQKAIDDGRLDRALQRRPGRPVQIDRKIGDEEWDANTNPSQRRSGTPGADRPAQQATLFAGTDEAPEGTHNGADADARSLRSTYHAQAVIKMALMRIQLQERRGKLADVDSMKNEALQHGATIRDAVMGVPARIRDELFAAKTPHAQQQLLESELEAALNRIAAVFEARAAKYRGAPKKRTRG